MSKLLFTALEDEKLVEWVAKYPSIYDISLPTYKNQRIKDSSWKEISEYLGKPAEECRKRWKNIKETFHKRKKKGTGTGSSADTKQKWFLADMLSFLEKTEYKRKSKSNIEEYDSSHTAEEDGEIGDSETEAPEQFFATSNYKANSMQTSSSTSRLESKQINKRQNFNEKISKLMEDRQKKRTVILKSLSQGSDDDVDLFFKSIAMSVKKLPSQLINEAKMKTLQLVFDLQSRANSETAMPISSPGDLSTSSSNISNVCSPPPQFTLATNSYGSNYDAIRPFSSSENASLLPPNLYTGYRQNNEDIAALYSTK